MLTVRTLSTLRDRLPTPAERDRLLGYAGSARHRVAAAQELERVERPVAEAAVDAIKKLYPNFPRFHAAGWEKGIRDFQLLLGCMARAMVLDDPALYDDQVLVWCRTIFKSLNFTPKFLRDSYTILRDEVRRRVTPRAFAFLEPYLDHTIAFLSDIPEPAKPEV